MKSVSAAEASRHFSSLLREVSCGVRITVTLRGKPVATISGADLVEHKERAAARHALLSRLRATTATGTRGWSRIEIHRDALLADWELAVNGQAPFSIDPLR